MSKISSSPQRYTFQAEEYVKRCVEEGVEPDPDYLNIYDVARQRNLDKMDAPEKPEHDLEYDLRSTQWIVDKVRASDVYAQNLYAAMCNRDFRKLEVMPILKDSVWGCSWRYAGGIIADMRGEGDYIDWYCSGIREDYNGGYVQESIVTTEIEDDLHKLGWLILPSEYDDQE
jgi:hypothetical protein